ncbi:MAG: flagellar export chaperone FliS [Granulosicoccaceae bacterium]
MYNNEALAEYNQVGTYSGAAYADPHQLIMMLYDGAINRLAKAGFALEHGSMPEVNKLVADVVSIVEGLRECLDADQGGDLANNLGDLYQYMVARLLRANIEGAESCAQVLSEVSKLLQDLREAWASIPVAERNKTAPTSK